MRAIRSAAACSSFVSLCETLPHVLFLTFFSPSQPTISPTRPVSSSVHFIISAVFTSRFLSHILPNVVGEYSVVPLLPAHWIYRVPALLKHVPVLPRVNVAFILTPCVLVSLLEISYIAKIFCFLLSFKF